MAHPHKSQPEPPIIGRPRCSIIIDGDTEVMAGDVNKAPNRPLRLRRIVAELGISTNAIRQHIIRADGDPVSKTTISQTMNKGYIPGTVPNYKKQFEDFMREQGLSKEELATMWQREKSAEVIPLGSHPRPTANRTPFSETLKEAEMLTPTTMKNFRLFRNPFLDDVQESSDVFMSESHSYAHAAMMDSARNGGFVAVIGECGAGKSIMRRKLISELQEAGDCRVIEPQTIDKTALTSGHILDAIIFDLDPDAKLRQSKEAKARQVRSALLASSRAGQRHVLIIEESHDLSVPTMKQLKRLWEIEDGYRKVLGIVLVGQPELQLKLNRQTHPEMREVILRCLIGTLESLNRDDCERYINLKFDRISKPINEVLADGCIDAVMARLTARGGIPTVYPLYINHLHAKAMNAASQFGAPLVTPEIIQGV